MDQERGHDASGQARAVGALIGFCAGLVIGFCVGFGAALTSAPQPGSAPRGQLRAAGLRAKGRLQGTLDQAKQRAGWRSAVAEGGSTAPEEAAAG